MHVLVILDHPDPGSFSHALAAAFMSGAEAAGHSVELGDLHAEGFNPLWSMADIAGQDGLRDVLAEQARIERADAIALVFPLFWWGMPSMMKGWIDRVWRSGWAYDQLEDPERSLLRPRTGVLLVAAGASSDEMAAEGYGAALETAWMKGTFGYFGLSPRRIELLCGTHGSAQRRAELLARCVRAGRDLPEPGSS